MRTPVWHGADGSPGQARGKQVSQVAEPSAEVPAASVPDGAWLLDVREDEEWTAGHAPGATHIPLGQLTGPSIPDDHSAPYFMIPWCLRHPMVFAAFHGVCSTVLAVPAPVNSTGPPGQALRHARV